MVKNVLVYASPSGSVCQCRHPTIAMAPNGQIHVMFRNELEGARDMYVVSSADGGRSFKTAEKLGGGTWMLNACPMDGGAMALDSSGRVETVRRREKTLFSGGLGQREDSLGSGKDGTVAAGFGDLYFA